MCVKALHILDMAFSPPFPKEFHPCRWLYNLQTLINICILSCGLFPKSQSSVFIWLWIAPPGESSSIYNSVCPVEMPSSKPLQTLLPSFPRPPAVHAVPRGLVGTWPHHTPTTSCWPDVLSIWQGSPSFCPHRHSPGSCSLRISVPTTSLPTAPTAPSLHQKELLQACIWLYPSLSRTVSWLSATFVIKVKYHNLTCKWFMNSSQVAFPAISSPTHIPLPKPSCSSHIELFLQTQQIFSSLWAFFLALCLAFFLVSADGLVRAWTLETECLNSHPVSALGMILVLPGVQPEADSETKSQQFIWRFRKYH